MLHGDEVAEFLQSVNIANLIHELNTTQGNSNRPVSRNDMTLTACVFVSVFHHSCWMLLHSLKRNFILPTIPKSCVGKNYTIYPIRFDYLLVCRFHARYVLSSLFRLHRSEYLGLLSS